MTHKRMLGTADLRVDLIAFSHTSQPQTRSPASLSALIAERERSKRPPSAPGSSCLQYKRFRDLAKALTVRRSLAPLLPTFEHYLLPSSAGTRLLNHLMASSRSPSPSLARGEPGLVTHLKRQVQPHVSRLPTTDIASGEKGQPPSTRRVPPAEAPSAGADAPCSPGKTQLGPSVPESPREGSSSVQKKKFARTGHEAPEDGVSSQDSRASEHRSEDSGSRPFQPIFGDSNAQSAAKKTGHRPSRSKYHASLRAAEQQVALLRMTVRTLRDALIEALLSSGRQDVVNAVVSAAAQSQSSSIERLSSDTGSQSTAANARRAFANEVSEHAKMLAPPADAQPSSVSTKQTRSKPTGSTPSLEEPPLPSASDSDQQAGLHALQQALVMAEATLAGTLDTGSSIPTNSSGSGNSDKKEGSSNSDSGSSSVRPTSTTSDSFLLSWKSPNPAFPPAVHPRNTKRGREFGGVEESHKLGPEPLGSKPAPAHHQSGTLSTSANSSAWEGSRSLHQASQSKRVKIGLPPDLSQPITTNSQWYISDESFGGSHDRRQIDKVSALESPTIWERDAGMEGQGAPVRAPLGGVPSVRSFPTGSSSSGSSRGGGDRDIKRTHHHHHHHHHHGMDLEPSAHLVPWPGNKPLDHLAAPSATQRSQPHAPPVTDSTSSTLSSWTHHRRHSNDTVWPRTHHGPPAPSPSVSATSSLVPQALGSGQAHSSAPKPVFDSELLPVPEHLRRVSPQESGGTRKGKLDAAERDRVDFVIDKIVSGELVVYRGELARQLRSFVNPQRQQSFYEKLISRRKLNQRLSPLFWKRAQRSVSPTTAPTDLPQGYAAPQHFLRSASVKSDPLFLPEPERVDPQQLLQASAWSRFQTADASEFPPPSMTHKPSGPPAQ
jgi:hypothetical protein